jgi:hypothetical protein
LANSIDRSPDPGLPAGYVVRAATFHDLDTVADLLADVDVALFGEAEPSASGSRRTGPATGSTCRP